MVGSGRYKWRDGARICVDPNIAGVALDAMAEEHGRLTAGIVVAESRPEHAPLHPAFEWDNSLAAELYREHQARHIVRSIIAVKIDSGGETSNFHKFVHVKTDIAGETESVYISAEIAMTDKMLRRQVLQQAMAELRAFQRKYSELEELVQVFAAIDTIRIEGGNDGDQ